MPEERFGYARVGTDGQTLDAQQAELRSAGAERVYSEKISGAISDRPALAKAIAALGNGDYADRYEAGSVSEIDQRSAEHSGCYRR